MQLNNSDQYESINVRLDEIQHPIAFATKVQELVNSGMKEDEAKKFVRITPIELEIYYSESQGLFGIEAEAVDSGTIYNPYSGELMEDAEEI